MSMQQPRFDLHLIQLIVLISMMLQLAVSPALQLFVMTIAVLRGGILKGMLVRPLSDLMHLWKQELTACKNSKTIPYNELTNYLLSKPLQNLLQYKNNNCNCIGHPNYYKNLFRDVFNNKLKFFHKYSIIQTNTFVAGTIFYSPAFVFDKILLFIEENNRKNCVK